MPPLRFVVLTLTMLPALALAASTPATKAAAPKTAASAPKTAAPKAPASEDPYQWLEDVTGDRAMTWVQGQNKVSSAELTSTPEFEAMRSRFLTILNSNARIPAVAKIGDRYYNFW